MHGLNSGCWIDQALILEFRISLNIKWACQYSVVLTCFYTFLYSSHCLYKHACLCHLNACRSKTLLYYTLHTFVDSSILSFLTSCGRFFLVYGIRQFIFFFSYYIVVTLKIGYMLLFKVEYLSFHFDTGLFKGGRLCFDLGHVTEMPCNWNIPDWELLITSKVGVAA